MNEVVSGLQTQMASGLQAAVQKIQVLQDKLNKAKTRIAELEATKSPDVDAETDTEGD